MSQTLGPNLAITAFNLAFLVVVVVVVLYHFRFVVIVPRKLSEIEAHLKSLDASIERLTENRSEASNDE